MVFLFEEVVYQVSMQLAWCSTQCGSHIHMLSSFDPLLLSALMQVCVCKQLSRGRIEWHLPSTDLLPHDCPPTLLPGRQTEVLQRQCQEVLQAH